MLLGIKSFAPMVTERCRFRNKTIYHGDDESQVLFELHNRIGKGAYGSVYRSTDHQQVEENKIVAIKVLAPKIVLKKHTSSQINHTSQMLVSGIPYVEGATLTREHITWIKVGNDLVATLAPESKAGTLRELTLPECIQVFDTVIPGLSQEESKRPLDDDSNMWIPSTYKIFLEKRAKKLREGSIMKQLDSQDAGILTCHAIYEDIQQWSTTVLIVTDFAHGGDLFDYVVSEGTGGSQQEKVKKMLRDLIRAVAITHQNGIAHRDIKLDNLLLAEANSDSQVILADWGLAQLVDGPEQKITCRNGTPGYWAPEMWENKSAPFCPYKADSWAIGAAAYCLLKGHPPFNAHPWKCKRLQLYRNWQKSNNTFNDAPEWLMPKNIFDSDTREFLCELLCANPNERRSVTSLLHHPWLEFQQNIQNTPLMSPTSDGNMSAVTEEFLTDGDSLSQSSFEESECKLSKDCGNCEDEFVDELCITAQCIASGGMECDSEGFIELEDLQGTVYRGLRTYSEEIDDASEDTVELHRNDACRYPMTSNDSIASSLY